MNGVISFADPTIAELGAVASLWLLVQTLNAAKTNQSRVRVQARRWRSH